MSFAILPLPDYCFWFYLAIFIKKGCFRKPSIAKSNCQICLVFNSFFHQIKCYLPENTNKRYIVTLKPAQLQHVLTKLTFWCWLLCWVQKYQVWLTALFKASQRVKHTLFLGEFSLFPFSFEVKTWDGEPISASESQSHWYVEINEKKKQKSGCD